MDNSLLLAVLVGVTVLLFAIIRLKLPAFIALLITSIVTGLIAGLSGKEVMEAVNSGMGSTLGFVATVVGLGAIFGGILEKTGGANVIAKWLVKTIGIHRAPLAMVLTGFIVGMPVFFDVGIIILFPMVLALHRQTKKSILHYAVPLLSGLAVAHAFIPPTPGPIAVAEALSVNLGSVIFVGIICGLPAALITGLMYGKYLGSKLSINFDDAELLEEEESKLQISTVLPILLTPILLIVAGTIVSQGYVNISSNFIRESITIIGHPFGALIVSNLLAWYVLGKISGMSNTTLSDISTKAIYPAGIIILVTGAGGVFKQILVNTGAGEMIANSLQNSGMDIIWFAFISAFVIRVMQGSATVAMITAAGITAPLLSSFDLTQTQISALVVAIASGATMTSHLNDSGFWLVKEYFRLDVKQTIQTWTIASSMIGLIGFIMSLIVFYL